MTEQQKKEIIHMLFESYAEVDLEYLEDSVKAALMLNQKTVRLHFTMLWDKVSKDNLAGAIYSKITSILEKP